MIPYLSILERVFNRPLLVTPQKADIISAYLLSRVDAHAGSPSANERGIEEVQAFEPTANEDGSISVHSPRSSRFLGAYERDEKGKPAPYRIHNGIAIITIVGSLCNRGAWIGASSGLVSYEGIMHQLSTAVADERVKSILLDIESPGGEAVGCFEVAAAVRKAAQSKKVVGLVNGMACSAAYAILSGCSERYTTPSGIVGSIGVVLLHLDFSRYMANEGVKPTFIFAGKTKVDGNQYEPLKDEARASLQEMVDQFYDSFVATVAAGTSLSDEEIRATEARTYIGQEAVSVGLVDKVATIEEIIATMTASEIIQPSTGMPVIEPGGAKSSAIEGADMSFKDEFRAFLGLEPVAETPVSVAPVVQPGAVTEAAREDGNSASLSAEVTRLQAEIARRDADAAAKDAAAKAEADALRTTAIAAEADAFMTTHAMKFGKESAAPFKARYLAAKTAGDNAAVADLEALAAALPEVGASERLDTSGGLTAEQLAVRADPKQNHHAILDKLAAEGVTQKSPDFAAKYEQEMSRVA